MIHKLSKIINYLQKQTTLTLSCNNDGYPWCCNCFYVFDPEAIRFIITSSVSTRHAKMMLNNPSVAGTITDQPKFIGKIIGVQYQGIIRQLFDKEELQARHRFCHRYPIAKIIQAPMWEIQINELKMTNNTLGFASKTSWFR